MHHLGRTALRVTKNHTKGYSDAEIQVRDATSNDPNGPSETQMNAIARLTYNENDFNDIMNMLGKRLNDKGKNWRHVSKSLTVVHYCLHNGSMNVVILFRFSHICKLRALREFQYMDNEGNDRGVIVREKAMEIVDLLEDELFILHGGRCNPMQDGRIDNGVGAGDEETMAESRDTSRTSRQDGLAERQPEDELVDEGNRWSTQEWLPAEERDLQWTPTLSEEKRRRINSWNPSALLTKNPQDGSNG